VNDYQVDLQKKVARKLSLQSQTVKVDTRFADLVAEIWRLRNDAGLTDSDEVRKVQDDLGTLSQSLAALFRKVSRDNR
jgi:hypothetical protein